MTHAPDANEFVLLPEHFRLLASMYVDYGPEGTPIIDQKRPYGNSGDLVPQVYEKINGASPPQTYAETPMITTDDADRLMKRHSETCPALQIILCHLDTGKLPEPGVYRLTEQYDVRSWVRVGDA